MFVSINPAGEIFDDIDVPGFVRGAPVEDVTDDGNAVLIDTEPNGVLSEIRTIVFAVSVGNFEFLIGVSLEVSLNGDSRCIGVDDGGRLCFAVSSFPQHGPEDRAESCFSKLI